MNTKGIKFLAVLAVMVMAFAAIVALAPADKDVTAIEVYGNDDVEVDPTVIEGTTDKVYFYISEDASVKIKELTADVTFYVQNGKELELNIKGDFDNTRTIKIYSVTADQQRHTTSTVDKGKAGGEDGLVEGKIVLKDTEVVFKIVNPSATATVNQSVVYTAMMPYSVTTYTTSGSQVITEVMTYGTYTQNYATISSDAVLDATIAKLVTVAPGQSIQTKAPVDMNYGIMTTITSEITYYAKGMNAGTITVAENDVVDIKDGSAIVATAGNVANVKATAAQGVTLTGAADNAIAVSGSLDAGTLTVSGTVSFDTAFVNYSTITLNSSAKVTGSIEIDKSAFLYLKNDKAGIEKLSVTGKGTIVAQNEKLWDYGQSTDPVLTFANTGFEGQFDVFAITKVAEVKDAFSTALIKKNQTFRVVADTVVTTALDVEGVLIIEPGVTLTISKINGIGAAVTAEGQYAQIINNGEILIQSTAPEQDPTTTLAPYGLHSHGGLLENNGKIVASSDAKALAGKLPTFEVYFMKEGKETFGAGFINNGTITSSRNDIVSLDDNFVNNGSVSISGTLISTGLVNKGIFTLNNAKIGAQLTVDMQEKGAVFNISSAEVVSGAVITVQKGSNSVVITAPTFTEGKCTIRGITAIDASKKIDLSGTFAVTKPTLTETQTKVDDVKVATNGKIQVSDSATISKGFALDFTAATDLTVSGTMTVAKDVLAVTSPGNLTMTVSGLVACIGADQLAGCTFVAAKYDYGNDTYYTTLETAVLALTGEETAIIEVGDDLANKKYVTVTEDIEIPEGMTITGKYLAIDEQANVFVKSNAMVSFDTLKVVDGKIEAEDANNINIESVKADVKVQDEESTAAKCMSLNVALMIATPGDVIELSQEYVGTDTELVIPEGVKVDATAADEATDFVLINSNLVVNGVLVVDIFKFIATTDDTIGITLNGTIYDSCSDGSCFAPWWYVPFGVSSNITDEETDKVWYVLTNIAYIQDAINAADDAKVAVEGDAVLDELNVTGRDDMPAEVTFKGNVDIDNINIDDVTLKFTKGKKINTTISDAVGSITVTGAYAGEKMSIYSMDDAGVYLAGEVTDGKDGTYGIRFDGITGMDGTTKSAINWTSKTEIPNVLFAGNTTVIGKKAYIQFDDEDAAIGMATITGALVADNNAKIIINSDVQVLGVLAAAERTEEAVAGAVEVNGNMFVGALESDLYNPQDAINAYKDDKEFAGYVEDATAGYGDQLMKKAVTAAAAIVSGNVVVSNGFITVLEGSEVDDAIIEDLEFLEVIIEDEVWITVYGDPNALYSMDGLKAPIFNAKVTTILDAYGNPVAKYSHDYKVIYGSTAQKLSAYGEGVLISLDYDVFSVVIKTDGSVKAVYIDGILMYTGENKNTFTLDKVATGTHKVTVEAATGYDASKCVLYTEMGTILPGMSFTFTEFDCDDYVVIYNINGTEIQPEPVPPTPEEESQWTITTILLVILVVLIAIMAVIVALRLNRS
jgi:hypothetical protein